MDIHLVPPSALGLWVEFPGNKGTQFFAQDCSAQLYLSIQCFFCRLLQTVALSILITVIYFSPVFCFITQLAKDPVSVIK